MIIKNNFNSKSVNPTDYQEIGKGSHALEKETNNIINPIIQDILDKDSEQEEKNDADNDKWSFFR